jgi:hypothetical protein
MSTAARSGGVCRITDRDRFNLTVVATLKTPSMITPASQARVLGRGVIVSQAIAVLLAVPQSGQASEDLQRTQCNGFGTILAQNLIVCSGRWPAMTLTSG